jgi:hypothetical protein
MDEYSLPILYFPTLTVSGRITRTLHRSFQYHPLYLYLFRGSQKIVVKIRETMYKNDPGKSGRHFVQHGGHTERDELRIVYRDA